MYRFIADSNWHLFKYVAVRLVHVHSGISFDGYEAYEIVGTQDDLEWLKHAHRNDTFVRYFITKEEYLALEER